MNLLDLHVGEEAYIKHIEDETLMLRLMQFGCVPGEKIMFSKVAPLGCPYVIKIGDITFCVRKSEAEQILVEKQ